MQITTKNTVVRVVRRMIVDAKGTFFVEIKRRSFAKNPDAGRTTSQTEGVHAIRAVLSYDNLEGVLDQKQTPLTLFGIYPILEIDKSQLRITIDLTLTTTDFDGFKQKIEEYPKANLMLLYIKKTTDIITVEHPPFPDYLFEYEDSNVMCKRCHSIFSHQFLQSDSDDCDLIERICPICKTPYCCNVEYEDPETVARELGMK